MTDLNSMTSEEIYNLALKYENDEPINLEESTRLLKTAAEKNNIMAMNKYGVHLMKGIGCSINKEEASRFFKMSADLGNEEASYNYATMLYKGDGIPRDLQKSKSYYKIAADKGKIEAQIKYGKIVYNRNLTKISPDDFQESEKYFTMFSKENPLAYEYYMIKLKRKSYGLILNDEQRAEMMQGFKKLSDEGFLKATYQIALYLNYYSNELEGLKEALRMFKIAADKGHVKSMFEYARNVDDKSEQTKYFKMAADNGHIDSMIQLGRCYKLNNMMNEAARYFKMAADKNDIIGLQDFCSLLRYKKIEFDPKLHLKYYEEIAENGETEYGHMVGLIKLKGLYNVKIDKIDAANWFKKMADKGDIQSMIKYCSMCFNGDGIPVNKKEAAKYYQQMHDEGHTDKWATAQYGSMFYFGDGVPQDYKKAAYYFEKAAELNSDISIYALGNMNYKGQGMPKNIEKAMELYKRAADLGNDLAIDYLKKQNNSKKTKATKSPKESNKKKDQIFIDEYESDDDSADFEPKNILIAPNTQTDVNFKCNGSFKFNGRYLMVYDHGLFRWKGKGTYEFDGTYLMPYEKKKNIFQSECDGSYKFDGNYLMPYQNGKFQSKCAGAYKFDGSYLMPYNNGEFQSKCAGAYKFDGTFLIPYNNGEFNINNKGTYKFSSECKYPFIIIPLIQ